MLNKNIWFSLLFVSIIFAPFAALAGELSECEAAQAADINNDEQVNWGDLNALFEAWGQPTPNPADVNGDGAVNFGDIFTVISYFGPVAEHCTEIIELCADLELIRAELGAHYILTCDIDLAGLDFAPIGTSWAPFTGVLDGAGHSISNFSHTSDNQHKVGLFGSIIGGTVKNLNVVNAQVTSTNANDVGLLAGFTNSALIENCTSSGFVSGTGHRTGGLVGHVDPGSILRNSSSSATVVATERAGVLAGVNHGSLIENCSASGSVTGRERIGGLIGYTARDEDGNPTITRNSLATATVTATGPDSQYVGGFVGYHNDGLIDNCEAHGPVSGATQYTGGFAGATDATFWVPPTISNSHATGAVSSAPPTELLTVVGVGGFIGNHQEGSLITNSTASGPVNSEEVSAAGGFVGIIYNDATINNCHTTSSVTNGSDFTGGFIGYLVDDGVIMNSSSSGNVIGGGTGRGVGGFIGEMPAIDATVSNCNSTGSVSGLNSIVGGFVGVISQQQSEVVSISNSYSTGNVEVMQTGDGNWSNATAGGFVGQAISGIIEDSFSSGDVLLVSAPAGNIVPTLGGFAGSSISSVIRRSRSVGNVTGFGNMGGFMGSSWTSLILEEVVSHGAVQADQAANIGGLIGRASSALGGSLLIRNSASHSDIIAQSSFRAAGLIGSLYDEFGEITNCYASGLVDAGVSEHGGFGLLGYVSEEDAYQVTNTYWDIQATGQSASYGLYGEGRTTAEMTSVPRPGNTYVGWDFNSVWEQANGEYPQLMQTPVQP